MRKKILPLIGVLLLAAACSKDSEPPSGTPAASKNRDTYVHVALSDIVTLDPDWMYDAHSHAVIINIYETLLAYKGESITELVPLIAEKVPSRKNGLISPDGRTYTFPIRKGVKFHEGGEVTPEDVRYSLMRFMLWDRPSGPSSLLLEPVTGLPGTLDARGKLRKDIYERVSRAVRVEGDSVVLELHEPFPPILTVLASWAPVISKRWTVANDGWDGTREDLGSFNGMALSGSYLHEHADGTGPFRLERWDKKDREIVLTRFEDYWREPAKLKRAVIKGVGEFQTRKLMLAAGDADSISADYLHLPLLENLDGVEIIDDLPSISMSPVVFFVFHIEPKGNPGIGSGRLDGEGIPPDFFSDIRIRKAFAHAFDYEGYIRDVNRGKGTRATSFIPAGLPGHNPDQKVYDFDLEAAEREFREARGGEVWKKGFRFTLAYNEGNQSRQVIATMIKRAVEGINPKFRIDTKVLQWSTYLDQSEKAKLPMYVLGWAPDFPDPHNFAFPYMHSQGNYPRVQRYRNPEADRLVDKARTETDPEKRKKLYYRLQEIAYEDVPAIFILNSVRFRVQRSWVKGYVHNPVYPNACPLYYLSKS